MSVPKGLVQNITCHAFNKDGSLVAIAPNNHEVHIYATEGSEDFNKWTRKYVLDEHSGFVSSIDWNHDTNRIVTCAHDRNAYVWTFDAKADAWRPMLVILRINRGATHVKWSPSGAKFAVSCGAKCVPICHYEESGNWWITKMVKNHKSTVLSVDWCPNSKLIVTGSSDRFCRIFSAFIKNVDASGDDGFGAVFPKQDQFGECLMEFDQARAWVHTVAWAPSGYRIAFAGHASTVHFVQLLAGGSPKVQAVYHKGLPMLDIKFLSDNALVGAGWDCNPQLFTASGSDGNPEWAIKESLDKEQGEVKADAPKGAFGSALKTFADSSSKGIQIGAPAGGPKGGGDTLLKTRHQNTITCIWPLGGSKKAVVTTSGTDGRVLYWDLVKLGVNVQALKI